MSGCQIGSAPFPDSAVWLVDAVASLNTSYAAMHPTIAVFLCVAGTAMNVITVAVLTRPSMLSPVNVLLCAVAICDIIVMSFLFIFVSHFLIASPTRCEASDYSYWWAIFLFLHAQATVVFHATSIWLTVLLAQIRVLTIRRATRAPSEAMSARSTAALAIVTLLLIFAVNIPSVLTFKIITMSAELWLPCLNGGDEETDAWNGTAILAPIAEEQEYGVIYHLQASQDDCSLLKLAFWTNGLLFKVVPCALLTLSIVALLKIIADVADRRRSLAQVMNKRRMPSDHTTPMLVAVLSIFLIAELPQGILHVCNAIFSNETFYQKIYLPLGDLLDLLSLLNSAVNFLIYCAMSRKFRVVFLQLLQPCLPSFLIMRLHSQMDGVGDVEVSRHRPSAITDLTKTEQVALTSHRPSATSMLLRAPSTENLSSRMYGGPLLAAVLPDQKSNNSQRHSFLAVPGCASLTPRVSFDDRARLGGRSSLEMHEPTLVVPPLKGGSSGGESPSSLLSAVRRRLSNLFANGNPMRPAEEEVLPGAEEMKMALPTSSPQRRANLIQAETHITGY